MRQPNLNDYLMTQEEKESLIENLTQDISFLDEESLFEIEDHFENVSDYETDDEVF